MPTLIPLIYYSQQVGHARVDPPLGELPSSLRWGIALPDSIMRQHSGRPDVILARLRTLDDTLLSRAHPFTQLTAGSESLNLKLSRVALRHELIPLLRSFVQTHNPDLIRQARAICSTVHRAIYLDRDRTHLTLLNLREIPASGNVA